MTSRKSSQSMKPATVAKKLGIFLPAAPAEFQEGMTTREELNEMQANPPEWLTNLRRNGPHPRSIVAARLGVSIAGLTRNGFAEPLMTDEINEIRKTEPKWLIIERQIALEVREEEERVKKVAADKARREERKNRNK